MHWLVTCLLPVRPPPTDLDVEPEGFGIVYRVDPGGLGWRDLCRGAGWQVLRHWLAMFLSPCFGGKCPEGGGLTELSLPSGRYQPRRRLSRPFPQPRRSTLSHPPG